MTLLSTEDAAQAVSHPLRARILKAMARKECSPSDLAAQWDERIGNVSYHVRTLHKLGAIREVRRGQVRGAVEHYYRANVSVRIIQRELRS